MGATSSRRLTITVGDYTGLALAQALTRVIGDGLQPGTELVPVSDPADAGVVLAQEPDPGAEARPQTQVSLQVGEVPRSGLFGVSPYTRDPVRKSASREPAGRVAAAKDDLDVEQKQVSGTVEPDSGNAAVVATSSLAKQAADEFAGPQCGAVSSPMFRPADHALAVQLARELTGTAALTAQVGSLRDEPELVVWPPVEREQDNSEEPGAGTTGPQVRRTEPCRRPLSWKRWAAVAATLIVLLGLALGHGSRADRNSRRADVATHQIRTRASSGRATQLRTTHAKHHDSTAT